MDSSNKSAEPVVLKPGIITTATLGAHNDGTFVNCAPILLIATTATFLNEVVFWAVAKAVMGHLILLQCVQERKVESGMAVNDVNAPPVTQCTVQVPWDKEKKHWDGLSAHEALFVGEAISWHHEQLAILPICNYKPAKESVSM